MLRLINYVSGSGVLSYMVIPNGEVKYLPETKYRYKKANPIDPTEVWKLGKYNSDRFACTGVVTPTEYESLLSFLKNSESIYIEFDLNGSVEQYPISDVTHLPARADDLRYFNGGIKFELLSKYITLGGPVDFGIKWDEDGDIF